MPSLAATKEDVDGRTRHPDMLMPIASSTIAKKTLSDDVGNDATSAAPAMLPKMRRRSPTARRRSRSHVVADHDGHGERGADEDDGPGQLRCNESDEGNGHQTQAEPHSACTTAPTATEVRTTMMTPAVTPSRAADGARRGRGAREIPALEGGQVVGRQVPERRQRDPERVGMVVGEVKAAARRSSMVRAFEHQLQVVRCRALDDDQRRGRCAPGWLVSCGWR